MRLEDRVIETEEAMWMRFNEGLLRIHKDSDEPNLLYYGASGKDISQKGLGYSITLSDLESIHPLKLFLGVHNLNRHTQARRTLTGDLQIRRTNSFVPGLKDVATFSREEYKILKEYF